MLEVGETGQFEDKKGGEKDKKELERDIWESLFGGGMGSSSSRKRESQGQSYGGQPLMGAWATKGQTGAGVVKKTGEPGKYPPGSSSGQTTPQPGSLTPNHRVDQSPSRQAQTPNWSTPTNYCHGNTRLQHSQSHHESSSHKYSPAEHRPTRRHESAGSYHHWRRESYDVSDDWKAPLPRKPDDGSQSSSGRRKKRGRGQNSSPQHTTDRDRRPGTGRGDSNSQYQRSKSDATDEGASYDPSQKPYSSWRTE